MTDVLIDESLKFNWADKSIAEIVYEFACIRGDLSDESGRDAMTRVIEWKMGQVTNA